MASLLVIPSAASQGLAALLRPWWRRRRPAATAPSTPTAPTTPLGPETIFRLKAWPELQERHRTADIYRMLSVMSHRPVSRHWMLSTTRVAPEALDALLGELVANGAVETLDASGFPAG